MQVWEKLFIDKISKIRDSEMKGFVKYGAGRSLEIALSEGISTASMLLIIGVTAKINDSLTSKIIISAILNILLIKLLIIYSSYGISCYYQINSLMDRVASVFAKEPIQPLEFHQEENLPSNDPNDKRVVIIEKLWCSYDEDIENQSILRDLSLSIEEGEFIGIFGEVGSGKSTFLNTLVNQIPHIKGRLTISKQMAFHESEPALFTGTIEENIRFGKTMTR
jgi:ATP-binding cassette subfamily C (CFTR/MRP) protein 4